ncbi:MAG: DUF421 domain-containing protein [Bacilli bacterium]|nr:DUF421 domain-containing protein [Bacilli bacterium]
MEILIIILKTILFYVLLILILRIMGKREVGELSIFDVVVFFLISELFSLAIDNDTKLINVIFPIALIVILQILTSFLALKNDKFRNLIDGKPVIIIKNGVINQNELRKQRYNIDDLFLQIREHDVDSFKHIAYAILETNGKLSIITYEECSSRFPFPIIQDGKINIDYLKMIKKDEKWLNNELIKRNINSYKDVFLLFYDKTGLIFVLKEPKNKK